MSRKVLSVLLATAMTASLLVGCSGSAAAPAAKAVKPYTETTPIEEILQHMTLEDAKAMVVTSGTCRGWTLEQVAERRKPSLKFYVSEGFQGGDNIFRAAARLMLNEVEKEAG